MPVAVPERTRWPQQVTAAHPGLRPLLVQDYAAFTEASGPRHVVLPATTSVGLIVKLEDSAHRPPAFVMGPHGRHTVLDGACAPSYLRVFLSPLGAYTLLGQPIDELQGSAVDLADLFGPAGARLVDQVREATAWTRQCALVDRLLLERLERGPRPSPEVRRAWTCLVATAGAAPISRIAAEVGWSHKHLITKFKQQIGLSPKTVARLVRLERVWRSLDQQWAPRWERIAADSGYADQAHLVRDFREFTGTTPTDYLARISQQRGAGPG
jgi:AraC-like DNA-binding protein